ncbi:ribose 5-phosphate isomerase B [candidate division KSB1 bacterium]|nr:ribose 5-phosphate isomerase B [candidate division KSB1 bacterium]
MPSSSNKPKRVITERDVLQAWQERKTQLLVPAGVLITPAARDAAKAKKIALLNPSQEKTQAEIPAQSSVPLPASTGVIVIGSDHGGYALKEQLKDYLRSLGYRHEDVGTFSEAAVDYPDIAELVAQKVANGSAPCGIVIDGAGVGSAIAANKIPGVRAAACYDTYTAKNSREHNNANVLSLGSRNLGIDIAKEIVKVWLATGFGGGRHLKRVEKILALEQKYFRGK